MIHILLAAYNEERDLPELLSEIGKQSWAIPYRILIVDDGSVDSTPTILKEALKRLPLTVVVHERNRGLGCALSTGFAYVANALCPGDVVITMDADRTHPAAMIREMAQKVNEGFDLVIASRFATGGAQTGLAHYRRALSGAARIVFQLLLPLNGVKDYTSGFRAFSGELIQTMTRVYGDRLVEENGFAATAELLLKAGRITSRITEIPLVLHYEYKAGESKMKVLRTIGRYMMLLSKMRKMNRAR